MRAPRLIAATMVALALLATPALAHEAEAEVVVTVPESTTSTSMGVAAT